MPNVVSEKGALLELVDVLDKSSADDGAVVGAAKVRAEVDA
jgi:hypothetical protein